MCQVLMVSRSGYYAWLRRAQEEPRGRAAEDLVLLEEIHRVHTDFGYYGAPRVHQALLAAGHHVGRHRVARLMRLHGIRSCRGKPRRPRSVPPRRRPEIPDLVNRDFHADVPNTVWFTDITQIRTGEGWLYAAVILDAFNREVISWAVADHDTPKTPIHAITDALKVRRPEPGCIIHSDRGYQFTAANWLNLATRHRLQVSFGARRSCYDNAAMESWFASFKCEELYPGGQPATRTEARTRLFTYIWTYNTRRQHSTLGYVSPRTYAAQSSTCP
jgi:putative transposase